MKEHRGHHPHGRGRRSWGGFVQALAGLGSAMEGDEHTGHRRRRRFGAGELQVLMLSLIEDAPLHGYAMIEAIEARTGGAYAPSPGVVYPTLTLLADMELAEERADGTRKLYAITAKGKAHLDARRDELNALLERLDAAGQANTRADAAPVWRAMMNLGSVLKGRMWDRGADRDAMLEAARIIDEAAQKIERL
ncbi:PadR family transcriptional regulator [Sphingosinicella soli]|uniref:DNA-binding PadR family transcriptional regulator n=1 Tax=Sphingosinicella soli TaxID=333708 RepID=A0A7W7B255_9SPHN|nr:PadR family transcriptional regulator [Sphingosinicella soli]MBB4632606.1 DNA-binding PadR family transcriptional regulator [Sphingosinicella soli]